MVLPTEVGDAAQDADDDDNMASVKAWLDSGGDVNDGDEHGYTLMHCCALGSRESSQITDANVSLARTLIALGADVSKPNDMGVGRDTPLHHTLEDGFRGGAGLELIRPSSPASANTVRTRST